MKHIKPPSSGFAVIERALSLSNEAMFTVALQRRRFRSREPEDTFVFWWWANLQFRVVALRRLRRAAEVANRVASVQCKLSSAIRDFDEALSLLRTLGRRRRITAFAFRFGRQSE
jgi:hypothetical protein